MIGALAMVVASATPVQVEASSCEAAQGAEVERLVGIELTNAPVMPAPLTATVTCRDQKAEVRVDDPVTRKTLMRTIDLSRVAVKARARTLALATVELVEASWSELLLDAERRVSADGEAPSSQVAKDLVEQLPVAPSTARVRVELFGSTRWLPTSSAAQWGGGLSVLWSPLRFLGVAFELGGERAIVRQDLGFLLIDSGSVSVCAAALLDLSPLVARLGAGARVGAARVTGVPNEPSDVRGATLAGLWAGPQAIAGLDLQLGMWVVGLSVEAGWAALPVRGLVDGRAGAGLDGAWVAGRLGVGIRR